MPSMPRSCVSVRITIVRDCGADVVEQRRVGLQVVVLLRVVADVDVVTEVELAEVRVGLAREDSQQAGLAGTVQAEHEQPIAAADIERDVLEHRRAAVGLRQTVRGDDRGTTGRRIGELHPQRAIALVDVHALRLEPDDVLFLAVRHRRLGGLGAEAIDDGLDAGDLLGLQHRLLGEALLVVRPRRAVLAVRALVLDDLADRFLGGSIEVQHTSDRLVEQVEVVADHQQRAAVGAQELQQPRLGVDVEVVGRLVEQQHVGAGEQDARELDAAPLATAEHADRQLQPIARRGPSPAAIARASLSAP